MAKKHLRKPRRDVFAHFEREANKTSRQDDDYQKIQAKWAEARARRDDFINIYTCLEKKLGDIQITVRPQFGKTPYRLELIVIFPEGVTTTQIQNAAPEIVRWRDSLTIFQGPARFQGIEHLAKIKKGSDGRHKLECSEPHLISEGLNKQLAVLLESAEYHREDCPPDNPPFNSEWCLSEARELFLSWRIPSNKQDRCIKESLERIRSGMPAFETKRSRNGYSFLDGPFTTDLVSSRIRNLRRRKRGL